MNHTNNPIERIEYCPQCAAQAFGRTTRKKLQCQACAFTLYMNAVAAVSALIVDDRERLLVTVRTRAPAQGRLDLPGGFVDPGETAEQAVTREIKEELGLDVPQLTYFCTEPNPCYHF